MENLPNPTPEQLRAIVEEQDREEQRLEEEGICAVDTEMV